MSSSRAPGESELKALKQVWRYNKANDISGLTFIINQTKIVNHIKISDFPHSSWISLIFSNDYMFDQKCPVSRTFQEGMSREVRQLLEEYPPPGYDPTRINIDNPFNSAMLMANDAYIAPVGGQAFDMETQKVKNRQNKEDKYEPMLNYH